MTTRWVGFAGILLLALALMSVLILPPRRVAEVPPLPGPNITERDRELQRAVEGALAYPRPYVLEGTAGELVPVERLTPVDVPGLPDFPDICRAISFVTGQPCAWHVERGTRNGQRLLSVWIESNGRIYAMGEYYEVAGWELGIDEVMNVSFVWRGAIRVLSGLEGFDLGTAIWQAGDRVIQFLIGSGAVRVFIDATASPEKAGWGEALFRNFIGVVKQISYDTWIYRIP